MMVGDLVMLKYPGQFKDDYTIAKVTAVHPSDDGLVRQVTVDYRKKNSKESPKVFKSKPLISERVAVHRLHKLQLVDEVLQAASDHQGGDVAGDGGDGVQAGAGSDVVQVVAGGGVPSDE